MKTKMSKNDIPRTEILKRRTEILNVLSGDLTHPIRNTPETKLSIGTDSGDASTLNSDIELSSAIAERYTDMLKEVDNSLQKVEEGTYGLCDGCGQKIGRRRLQVLPFTRYCVQCQREKEVKRIAA